ncbi:MAG: hypothetical protein K2H82_03510 [Oscillospiraceae bacterium]|nr:hypothetical protein [Oscillospiraceae bacterium]
MKKVTFWIILLIEFLCCWVGTDIFFGKGWLNALLLVSGNIVFAKLCYRKFLKWFEPPEADLTAVENAVLAVTAAELILFQILNIWLFYSI